MSRTRLLLGSLLAKYFLEYSLKSLQENLQNSLNFFNNIISKDNVKDFKINVIFKSSEVYL
jgi:hypothetical protein